MTQIESPGLLTLPDEVIQTILSYTPPRSVVSAHATCRRLATIANGPLLWRSFCSSAFKWWDDRHDYKSKLSDPSFTGWETLYAERHLASQRTREVLARLLHDGEGKLDAIQQLLDIGYDAKDVLIDASQNARSSDSYLAQRYWSHAALGCLNRYVATQKWFSFRHGAQSENTTETSFGALDLFILADRDTGDIDDIISRLDEYAKSVRTAHPNIDSLTPEERATKIAEHLQSKGWVGIHDNRNYHSLDHMFLGVALHSSNHNSVPLVSSIIYCYVARQFNLSASPISYPFHVHALVQPPPGISLNGEPLPSDHDPKSIYSSTHLYLDPFQSSTPIPLTHLQSQLRFISPHSTTESTLHYLLPSSPRDLTIRAAHNILSSPSHYSGPPLHPIAQTSATYAALFALVLLSPTTTAPAQLRQHLAVLAQHFLEYFDLDVHLFSTYILPLTTTLPDARAYRSLLQNLRDTDATKRPPKLRSEGENSVVKYRLGQVFRHRLRGYLAVIYGWDPWCKMQETWIAMNQVDRLSRGRAQPFYNVLVEDESTRYVAEENVNLLPDYELEAMGEDDLIARFPIEIGKYFKRWSWDGGDGMERAENGQSRGRFVSNLKTEYPED